MSDVQASKSVSSSAAGQPTLPVAGVAADKDATVRQTPPDVQPRAQHPVRVEGQVIAQDADTGETRIQTPRGEITVTTKAELPVDTKVTLDLYIDKTQTRARIYIRRQIEAAQQQAVETIAPPKTPPPPLATGATLPALRLPDETAAPQQPAPPPAAALTTTQVAHIIQAVQPYVTPQQLAAFVPVPQDVISQLLAAPDIPQAFNALSPQVKENLAAFIAKPETLTLIQSFLPEQTWQQLGLPATAAATSPDDALVEILARAYTPAPSISATQETATTQQPPSIPPAFRSIANAFLPLLGMAAPGTGGEHVLNPFTAGKFPVPQRSENNLLPKNMFNVKIISLTPPNAPAVPTAQNTTPSPQALEGTVNIVTDKGFPIIDTAKGSFILQTPAQVAEGTRLTVEVTPMTPQEILAQTPTSPAARTESTIFHPFTSLTWPALNEALNIPPEITDMASQTLSQNIRNALPSPTQRMAPTVLFFLAALRMGEIEHWLGEKTVSQMRQGGRRSLIERLTGDFGRIAEQSRETLSQGWKMISVPMMHDEQISQMHFYVRQQQQDSDDEETGGKPATRFLLNISLSRMGDMQLDGFLHKHSFDLILRSRDKLPFDIRQDIMQKFAHGLEQVNMQGGISFQTKAENWVVVTPASARGEMV